MVSEGEYECNRSTKKPRRTPRRNSGAGTEKRPTLRSAESQLAAGCDLDTVETINSMIETHA